MPNSSSDRNLLYGILALQMDFIDRDTLIEAMSVWAIEKDKPLGSILLKRGILSQADHQILESVVTRHIAKHGGNSEKSLAAVAGAVTSLREGLKQVEDKQLEQSLTLIPTNPFSNPPSTTETPPSQSAFVETLLPPGTDQFNSDPNLSETWIPESGTDHIDSSDPDFKNTLGSDEMPRSQFSKTGSIPSLRDGDQTVTGGGRNESDSSRYRVLKPHAKGGLGVVYVAMDEELRREVALKEIQIMHAHERHSRERFILEAEITGRLEHPGIVPVYGLGCYPDGRPFYAMRFIQGVSLKDTLREFHSPEIPLPEGERTLQMRKMLQRFVEVCYAIGYAHSRGIIHRDIKPDNIMVGKYGETLVVDWGLAKALNAREETPSTINEPLLNPSLSGSAPTQMGSVMGTPQYMSPEQAAGRSDLIGTSSDIYSLAATLYSILTGYTPFQDTQGPILQLVQKGAYIRPRQRLANIPLALEAICLKGMSVDIQNRYPTAEALADDLEHWLADEPVVAYHEPPLERLARWARRHRAWTQAAAATLFAVSIVSIIAFFVVDSARHRESLAKAEATKRSKQAREAVDTLLTGVGKALENYPGMQDARERLLKRAAEDYEKFTSDASGDPELRAEAGRSFLRLGDVRTMLNQLKDAVEAYQSGIDSFEKLVSETKGEPKYQLELASGRVRLGLAFAVQGKNKEAEDAYQKAIAMLEPLTEKSLDSTEYGDALGTALVNLGQLQRNVGDLQRADETLNRAITVFVTLSSRNGNSPRVQDALATARRSYGQFLLNTGHEEQSLKIFSDAIIVYDKLVHDFPDDPDYFASRAACRIFSAIAFRALGRYEDEISAYQEAVADYVDLHRVLPDVPRYREDLALTRTNFSQAVHKLKQNSTARPELKPALEEFEMLAAEYPMVPSYLEGLATVRTTIAMVVSDLGQVENAHDFAETATRDYQDLLAGIGQIPKYQAGLAIAHSQHARILARLERPEEAEPMFQHAFEEFEQLIAANPAVPEYRHNLADSLISHANWRHRQKDTGAAIKDYARARQIRDQLIKEFPDSPRFAASGASLLGTCRDEGSRDLPRAIGLAKRATDLAPESAEFWKIQGAVLYRAGKYEEADTALKRSQQVREADHGETLLYRAMARWQIGQKPEAREMLRSALDWVELNVPADEEMQELRREAETLIEPVKESAN